MKIITDPLSLFQNKSMKRGLHVFTSFISSEHDFIFLDAHLNRLLRGADLLFPEYSWPNKHSEINQFMSENKRPNSYFRLMIFDDTLVFSTSEHSPRQPGLTLGEAVSVKCPTMIPSYVKTGSYLNAELELRRAASKGFEDVLFFDNQSILCEASTSNVFIVTNKNKIYTPKTGSMVLEGVTRLKLMEFLNKNGYDISEADISREELINSCEIWLTNSISGIRSADSFNGELKSKNIYSNVCKKFGRFGEEYE